MTKFIFSKSHISPNSHFKKISFSHIIHNSQFFAMVCFVICEYFRNKLRIRSKFPKSSKSSFLFSEVEQEELKRRGRQQQPGPYAFIFWPQPPSAPSGRSPKPSSLLRNRQRPGSPAGGVKDSECTSQPVDSEYQVNKSCKSFLVLFFRKFPVI